MKKRLLSALMVYAMFVFCAFNISTPVSVEAKKGISLTEAYKVYEKDIIASARKTGVWASVKAGQLCQENGSPLSKLATEHNNFFGMKWSKKHAKLYPGAYPVNMKTRENTSDIITAEFTHFPTATDCFIQHSIIFWNGMYKPELKLLYDFNSTRDQFIKELCNGPYMTDPKYESGLRS